MADIPRRYDIEKDEMVPLTQADWDGAMKHILEQHKELERLRPKPLEKNS